MTPAKEQIKRFWEWCGLNKVFVDSLGGIYYINQDSEALPVPDIELNNLFKWAVPKVFQYFRKLRKNYADLTEEGKDYYAQRDLRDFLKRWIEGNDLTPLALFWAINQLIGYRSILVGEEKCINGEKE